MSCSTTQIMSLNRPHSCYGGKHPTQTQRGCFHGCFNDSVDVSTGVFAIVEAICTCTGRIPLLCACEEKPLDNFSSSARHARHHPILTYVWGVTKFTSHREGMILRTMPSRRRYCTYEDRAQGQRYSYRHWSRYPMTVTMCASGRR